MTISNSNSSNSPTYLINSTSSTPSSYTLNNLEDINTFKINKEHSNSPINVINNNYPININVKLNIPNHTPTPPNSPRNTPILNNNNELNNDIVILDTSHLNNSDYINKNKKNKLKRCREDDINIYGNIVSNNNSNDFMPKPKKIKTNHS